VDGDRHPGHRDPGGHLRLVKVFGGKVMDFIGKQLGI
jgi:hypothetical protein